jgi:hypothetical protein
VILSDRLGKNSVHGSTSSPRKEEHRNLGLDPFALNLVEGLPWVFAQSGDAKNLIAVAHQLHGSK